MSERLPELSKSVSVLDLTLELHAQTATFARVPVGPPEDNAEGVIQSVVISHEAWTDMGEPKQVTVTVEPGDNLNKAGDMAGFIRNMEPA